MKLRNRRLFPWLAAIVVGTGCAVVFVFVPQEHQLERLVAWLAASVGLAGFLYSKHLQETQLFKQLFTEFNQRYDAMNGELDRIRHRENKEALSPPERARLVDYFNLCAEEYLFFRSGYIDASVWASWSRGMAYFAEDAQIRLLWQDELKGESYYGFTLDLVV